jgi:hypothetical protein
VGSNSIFECKILFKTVHHACSITKSDLASGRCDWATATKAVSSAFSVTTNTRKKRGKTGGCPREILLDHVPAGFESKHAWYRFI